MLFAIAIFVYSALGGDIKRAITAYNEFLS